MNKLELKVLLSAIDKITKPLKAIQGGSSETAKALRAAKDQLKALNDEQKRVDGFRNAARGIAIHRQELAKAEERVRTIKQAMEAAEFPTREMQKAFKEATDEAKNLKGNITRLTEKQENLRRELTASGADTHKLAGYQRELKGRMAEATLEVDKQRKAMDDLGKRQQALHAARANYDKTINLRNKLAGGGAAAVATGAAMSMPIIKAVKDYASFEDAMLGVARQVDGARDANGRLTQTYYDIGESIKAMSERIPLATTEIAAIVEAGARMGIKGKENLLAYAETTAVMASAFDLPVDQVGEDVAKIAELYKVPIKSIGDLGDVINYLDDATLAKGGDIIDVMKRIAGTADTVGMKYKEAAALAGTFLSLGANSEVAASASNAIMTNLSIATMQPKRFQEGLDMIGMNRSGDGKEVQQGMSKDATGTILKVMDAIKKLPQEKQLEATTRLFGKEFGDDAAKLAGNLEKYRTQLELTNAAQAKGSMQREAEARNQALSARYEMLKSKVFNLSSALGESLKPALVDIMQSIADVLGSVRAWTKEHPELTANLVKGAAIIAAIVTGLGALTLAAAAVLGPIALLKLSIATLGIKMGSQFAVTKAAGSAFMFAKDGALALARSLGGGLLSPIGTAKGALHGIKQLALSISGSMWGGLIASVKMLRGALVLAGSHAFSFGSSLLRSLMSPITTTKNAFFMARNAVMVFGRALLMNPLGIGIAAIALGALLIYKYWGPIKEFFSGLWSGISIAAGPALQAMLGAIKGFATVLSPAFGFLIDGVSTLFGWLFKLIAPIESTGNGARNMGEAVGLAVGNIIAACLSIPTKFFELGTDIMRGLGNGILSAVGYVKNALSSAGTAMVGWFKEKLGIHSPSRVFAELGGFTMQGLSNGLQDGQRGPLDAVRATAKQLAAIGAGMAIGGGAFAGEQPIKWDTRPPISQSPAAASAAPTTTNYFTIHAAPGMNEQQLAQLVAREFDKISRQQAANDRSSLRDKE